MSKPKTKKHGGEPESGNQNRTPTGCRVLMAPDDELPREKVERAIQTLETRDPVVEHDPETMSAAEATEVVMCHSGYVKSSFEWLDYIARVIDRDDRIDLLEKLLHERIRECTAIIAKVQKAS
jgi:hypothetical protein